MKREEFSRYERLKVIMEDWANWSKGYRMKIGWPTRSIGIESGYVQSSTFDEMCDSMDHEINGIIDSAVGDLEPIEKASIYRRYGLSSVFRFPRNNYDESLIKAHENLLKTLPKKGVAI